MKKLRSLKSFIILALLVVILMSPGLVYGEAKSNFENGPYLLAPKTDSIVVMWELKEKEDCSINYYKESSNKPKKANINVIEGPIFKDKPMYLYKAELRGLEENTKYIYEIITKSGEIEKGSFKTLSTSPEEVKFLVLSDSHRFETAKNVGKIAKEFNPDFILHTGDMVEGTGTQKDQFTYWFNNKGNFLADYPVIYNSGNHDFGIYFDEYVTKIQKDAFKSNDNGRNISFDYGNVHFTMMDSNPWSLFELNSSASGEVDEETKKTVEDSLAWLKEDLESNNAKKADFRIVTMHHPYEDDLTRKYIPQIIEPAGVNLLIGGHTHNYSRIASMNPEVGLKTLYVTQGDARTGNIKIDEGSLDERLDERFPNMLAKGRGDVLAVTIKGDKIKYKNIGSKDDEIIVAEEVLLTNQEPKLKIEDVKVEPKTILSNGEINISAKVTNVGEGLSAAVIPVKDNGEVNYLYTFGEEGKDRVVALKPGESVELKSKLALKELGKHKIEISDYTTTVDVKFREATFKYEDLRIKLGDGLNNDIESNIVNIKSKVTNIGNEQGEKEVNLYIDGKKVDSKNLALNSNESKDIEFRHIFKKAGDYRLKVGNGQEREVSIQGGINGLPIVKDLSGNNNHALLRGSPKLVKHEKGYGVALDGIEDYIEIEDQGSYKIDDGVSGLVFSKINRLAKEGEWDHNPLLMKGSSISYGTNYLYRMAVRSTGKLTYGIGFDDDNGEYFWNDDDQEEFGAQIGKWTQYVGAFDRKSGGTSWQDTKVSGEIDPPDFLSEIRNWEGRSMYSGYSSHRHLLPNRDRGRTHTMLDADIGQIRFYDSKLKAETVEEIFKNPNINNLQKENLLIWLDFNPNNIKNMGNHTTDWIDNKFESLSYKAEIKGRAGLRAIIQVSNDEKEIIDELNIKLKDGENTIDLSKLKQGEKIRVKTIFSTEINTNVNNTPVLFEYYFKGENAEYRINTLADWRKGKFEGAVGHDNKDIFKDYSKDYDEY